MSTVAVRPDHVHDTLAVPLGQSLSEPGLILVALLVLAGLAVFQGLRVTARALGASLAASMLLVRPALALFRLLLGIVTLLVLVVAVLVGEGEPPTRGDPTPAPSTEQAPEPIGSLLPRPSR